MFSDIFRHEVLGIASLGGDSHCRSGPVVGRSVTTHTRSKPSFHTYPQKQDLDTGFTGLWLRVWLRVCVSECAIFFFWSFISLCKGENMTYLLFFEFI